MLQYVVALLLIALALFVIAVLIARMLWGDSDGSSSPWLPEDRHFVDVNGEMRSARVVVCMCG